MGSGYKIIRVIVLLLFLTLVFLVAPRITFNDTLENWIPPDSQIIHDYKSFLEEFQSDAIILITLEDPGNIEADHLDLMIEELIDSIKQLDNILEVRHWPPPYLQSKASKDEKLRSLYLTFIPPSHLDPNRPELVSKLHELLANMDLEYHMAGTGVIHKAINDMARKSSLRYLILGNVILLILLIIFLRDYRFILKTIGIALGSVGFIIIVAYLLKIEFNMIMSILPCLILFYGTSISIHILNHAGDIKKVIWPTIIAVITTCAGFSAFLFDSASLLRDFGLLAISGLLGGLFWAIFLYYPSTGRVTKDLFIKPAILRLEKYWNNRSLYLGLAILLLMIPGVIMIKAEIKTMAILPRDNKTVQDYSFIEQHVSYIIPVEYQVDLKKTSSAEVREWMKAVYQLDEIGAMVSYLSIPFAASPRKLGYISDDGKSGRIVFFVPVISTSEGLRLVDKIDSLSEKYFIKSKTFPRPTGSVSLYVSVAEHISSSFMRSLILAFTFVFIILFFYLRNAKLFLAAILPNILPVVAILGIMGWFRIPLDMVTFPMGCLALGIIVDDTIHFLHWYRKTGDLHHTLGKAGPGTVLTSLIYILGFMVFLLSDAKPVKYFGLLSITTMAAALYGDIVILPTILKKVLHSTNSKSKPNADEL
jgi:predicted RND superfamily exporter protein